jgi:cbb3-type cytochrome oxidase maturation protein
MTPILWLIALSVALGAGGLLLFLWASRNGQYDDMDGAAQRILFDDERKK